MNDLTLNIGDLKGKIEKLVKLHQELKKENEQLVSALEKNNKAIEASKNEEQTKIVVDTKEKINELVQEIDNCIALLK